MNLALLDPFQRQIPDRIDSTLTLPRCFHPDRRIIQNGAQDEEGAKLRLSKLSSDDEKSERDSPVSMDLDNISLDGPSLGQEQGKAADSNTKKPNEKSADEDRNWHSSYIVSFTENGTYFAVGHASGALPIYDFASRTLSCIHYPTYSCSHDMDVNKNTVGMDSNIDEDNSQEDSQAEVKPSFPRYNIYKNGVTSVSWSSTSRHMLVSSYGDEKVCLHDNTHPFGSRDVCYGLAFESMSDGNILQGSKNNKRNSTNSPDMFTHDSKTPSTEVLDDDDVTSVTSQELNVTNTDAQSTTRNGKRSNDISLATSHFVNVEVFDINATTNSEQSQMYTAIPRKRKSDSISRIEPLNDSSDDEIYKIDVSPLTRFQTLVIVLPRPAQFTEIHPTLPSGMACLDDGSLALFSFPTPYTRDIDNASSVTSCVTSPLIFKKGDEQNAGMMVYLNPPSDSAQQMDLNGNRYFITCAVFSKKGDTIFAATKCGTLLVYHIPESSTCFNPSELRSCLKFKIKIGNTKAYQILLSRNGKKLLINSTDNVLRLYNVEDCWRSSGMNTSSNGFIPLLDISPCASFHDAVTKKQWISCDFSANDEYVVGGCNTNGDKYELYVWDTTTGMLIDQLTGPQVSMNSISLHPRRPFIAVATDDGLVDIWGPRMDWTAFAPDFQALQKNVEYIEKEDEFDTVVDGDGLDELKRQEIYDQIEEKEIVDVVGVDKIHALFQDKDEESDELFYFETSIRGMLGSLRAKGRWVQS